MTDDALLRRLGVGDEAISAFCRKWRVAELASVFKRGVDPLERPVVGRSRNYIRRARILSSARVLHAA